MPFDFFRLPAELRNIILEESISDALTIKVKDIFDRSNPAIEAIDGDSWRDIFRMQAVSNIFQGEAQDAASKALRTATLHLDTKFQSDFYQETLRETRPTVPDHHLTLFRRFKVTQPFFFILLDDHSKTTLKFLTATFTLDAEAREWTLESCHWETIFSSSMTGNQRLTLADVQDDAKDEFLAIVQHDLPAGGIHTKALQRMSNGLREIGSHMMFISTLNPNPVWESATGGLGALDEYWRWLWNPELYEDRRLEWRG